MKASDPCKIQVSNYQKRRLCNLGGESEKSMQKQAVDNFINDWQEDASGLKSAFVSYFNDLKEMADIDIGFNERPGISYSLARLSIEAI
ncbi:MAG: hypothetical protein ABFS43_01000 [Thermodesulfobacteriota bacterium]